MNLLRLRVRLISTSLACALFAACGGGGGGGGYSMTGNSGGGTTTAAMGYAVSNLVADTSAEQSSSSAAHTDSNLINPWGIAFNPNGFVWVANAGSATTTLYDGNGVANAATTGGPLAISVLKGSDGVAGPTGVVYNSSISGGSGSFVMHDGAPAEFIYSTLGGTIQGWDNATNASTAINYDGGASGASYTGLALGQDGNGNYFLYAADFATGAVDVFDHAYNKITPSGGFPLPTGVPAGYAPFGIQNIAAANGSAQIYVTYAQQNAGKTGSVAGAGLGYVAVFDYAGNLQHLLISGGSLNAPWGVALAPTGFGTFGGALLVGNFGDGKINAYNASTGALMGPLMEPSGTAVQISGLWGIGFGNGANSQPTTTLFFAAGVNNQADGLYGRIDYGTGSSMGGSGGGGSPY